MRTRPYTYSKRITRASMDRWAYLLPTKTQKLVGDTFGELDVLATQPIRGSGVVYVAQYDMGLPVQSTTNATASKALL